MRSEGSGLILWGLWVGNLGLRYRDHGSGFRVEELGVRGQGSGFSVKVGGLGSRVENLGLWVWGLGLRVYV